MGGAERATGTAQRLFGLHLSGVGRSENADWTTSISPIWVIGVVRSRPSGKIGFWGEAADNHQVVECSVVDHVVNNSSDAADLFGQRVHRLLGCCRSFARINGRDWVGRIQGTGDQILLGFWDRIV